MRVLAVRRNANPARPRARGEPRRDSDCEGGERERERAPATLVEIDEHEVRGEQGPEERGDVRDEEMALGDVKTAEREQERREFRDRLGAGEAACQPVEDDDGEHAVEDAPRAAEEDEGAIGRDDPRPRVGHGAEIAPRELLLQEDREGHEREHLKVLAGGLPYEVREFIKKAAWEVIDNEDLRESPESLERAKRALAFAYWSRATSNSIPENELQPYMSAHFAWLDARAARDEGKIKKTSEALKRWNKYG